MLNRVERKAYKTGRKRAWRCTCAKGSRTRLETPGPRVLPGDGEHAVGCSPRPATLGNIFL